MPFATFTRVREVSSEDSVYMAENLIKSQPGMKWKTKNAGEKSAYVILEMSDSSQITGIDIGNEHSAFIEVLVGKSGCALGEFTEILLTSSFMTPTESKSSNNTNRVRCFNRDALVPTAAEDKWSLIKILCTQPFNKHVTYGLSFIKVHIVDNSKSASVTQKKVADTFLNTTTSGFGSLKFRKDSTDSESENSSSLFNRWKKLKHNGGEQTTAASIRMASPITRRISDDHKSKTSSSSKKSDYILDRNRENLLFDDETDNMNNKSQKKLERLSELIEIDKKRRNVEIETEINNKKRRSVDNSPKTLNNLLTKPSNSKSSETPTKKIKPKIFRPFNQLLKGVVLVISGIPNPDRAELRNKANAMGAKYKADWDNTCTHLICAFKNTPKYNQVKGVGKIVMRSWIEKCYSSKKYLPWRRYALDCNDLSKPESDEEILDDSQNYQLGEHNTDLQNTSLSKSKEKSEEKNDTLALYGVDDDRSNDNNVTNNPNSSSSEFDTDDEIKRVEQIAQVAKINTTSKNVDIYEASTDEEDYVIEKVLQNQ